MRILIILCITLFSFTSFSQIQKVVEGKEYTNTRKEAFNGFIGESALAVYGVDYGYVSKKKQELIIRKFYKNDLSLIESYNIYSNPLDDYINTPLELFYVNQQFYLFSQFDNYKSTKSKIGLFIFDENCNQISFKEVDTIQQIKLTKIEVKMADDSTGFVVMQSHLHKVANRQVVELTAIDNNGKTLWKKELLSTNSVNKTEVEQIIHTKNETYLLCNYGYKSLSGNNSLSNKYTLWVYNHELNFMKEVVLRLKRKWINGVKINLTKNNRLLIAGYVNNSKGFGINAYFNVFLNKKYEPQNGNYFKFSKDVFSQFISEKKLSKTNQLDDFYLRDVALQNDGSFYMIGEVYYKYVDRVYDPRTNVTSTTNHYNYNSILVSYFDMNGELKWHKRIAKFQNSTEDNGYYSSFSVANLKDNSIAIIYNDNEKNLMLSLSDYDNHKELFNNRRKAIVYVLADESGLVKRKRVVDKTNFLIYAKQSKAITNGNIYLKMEYGKHSKIMNVDFK